MRVLLLSTATLTAIGMANTSVDMLRTDNLQGIDTHDASNLMSDMGVETGSDHLSADELEYINEDSIPGSNLRTSQWPLRRLALSLHEKASQKFDQAIGGQWAYHWGVTTVASFPKYGNELLQHVVDPTKSLRRKAEVLSEHLNIVTMRNFVDRLVSDTNSRSKFGYNLYGLHSSDTECMRRLMGDVYVKCKVPQPPLYEPAGFWRVARVLSAVRMPKRLKPQEKEIDGSAFAFGLTFIQKAEAEKFDKMRADKHVGKSGDKVYKYIEDRGIKYCHSLQDYKDLLTSKGNGVKNEKKRIAMGKELMEYPPSVAAKYSAFCFTPQGERKYVY